MRDRHGELVHVGDAVLVHHPQGGGYGTVCQVHERAALILVDVKGELRWFTPQRITKTPTIKDRYGRMCRGRLDERLAAR